MVSVSQGTALCFVPGHLKYDQYVGMPGASHLRHPVNAYRWAGANIFVGLTPWNGYMK